MLRTLLMLLFSLSFILLSACNGDSPSVKEGDYDATKKMVVDILQTEDGKKALTEIMAEDDMKKQLVIESDTVKDSITHMLASEKAKEMWTELFKDPTFVKSFATSMADEQKKLMKTLMNDAEFQKQMIELLQNPEITDQMLNLMKSQQFRSHLEDTIQQTLETPLFQEKMKEVLMEAVEKKEQSDKQDQEGEEASGEQSDKSVASELN